MKSINFDVKKSIIYYLQFSEVDMIQINENEEDQSISLEMSPKQDNEINLIECIENDIMDI